MRYLNGKELEEAAEFMHQAAVQAEKAACYQARYGAIIVKNKKIIGRGSNSPPGDLESQRRCGLEKNSYSNKITDKTCCIHAEQRAVIDTLRNNPEKLRGSKLYSARINEKGEPISFGKICCTLCSKLALETGISEFILSREEGICSYKTEEYNNLCFNYRE